MPNAAQYASLRLVVDWALLSARTDLSTSPDTVSIRVRAGSDSAVLLAVTTADLQAGRVPRRAAGCGQHDFSNSQATTAAVAFPSCTDWQTSTIDLTAWRARAPLALRFVATEGAAPTATSADRATTLLLRRIALEGRP
jgi:hypothetical protein